MNDSVERLVTARTLISALMPVTAVPSGDDKFDAVVDALAEAAAVIEAALQTVLESDDDDEQTLVL